MNVYQDKQGKLRVERRVSTIADRRVKTPMARLGGTRAGLDNNYMEDMPYVVIGADRRAKTTNTDALTEGCPIEPPNPSDTAELLKKYRVALITAYELGESIKEVYGILPPKAIIDWDNSTGFTISLNVN